MKKILRLLGEYSHTILIFVTVLVLLFLISLFHDSMKNAADSMLQLRKVYTESFTLCPDNQLVMDVEKIENTLDAFTVEYSGYSGTKFRIIIDSLNWTMAEYEKSDTRERKIVLATTGQKQMLNLMDAYLEILDLRFSVFDFLFFFLSLGILMQFVFLVIANKRSLAAMGKVESSERNFFELQRIREEERRKIASFLHDSILQDMGSILLMDEVNEAEDVRNRLEDTIVQLRKLTYTTAPLHLYNLGLENSIRELAADFSNETGIITSFRALGLDDKVISKDAALILFRIVQESLSNIRKHSGASRVEISVVESFPYIILSISDNGCGFDPERVREESSQDKHFGLILMEQQIHGIKGEFVLKSTTDEGTSIRVKYNLHEGGCGEQNEGIHN